ncbi:hypothetical protein Ancab_028152 [Ancistrocladus abbreviatus]
MAASQNSITAYHTRSISLPSRPHPLVPEFEGQLIRLNSPEAASTSSSSISHKLSGLRDLYDCVDELLQLHLHQLTLGQDRADRWIDDLLDGSLRLLDVCTTARDVLSQTKECIQDIQSALRRRCSSELSFASEISQYIETRKKVKKTIKKCLKDIKSTMQSKNGENIAFIGILRDMEAVTAQTFKSLLHYIAGPKKQSKGSSWFIVSKLMNHNAICNDTENAASSASEFEEADAILASLHSQKKKTGINIVQADQLRSQMMQMDSAIQALDEQLDCLFRRMVKTRAALLNILSK